MAEKDLRVFKKYTVIGPVPIEDGQSGEHIAPGGVVALTEDPLVRVLELEGRQELPGTCVKALLYSGFIAPIEDAPATPKAAKG